MFSTRVPLAALAAVLSLTASGPGLAAEQVEHSPPNPAEVLAIADGVGATSVTYQPTATLTFPSKTGTTGREQLEAYVWKPLSVSAGARIPLVIVAHGHTGIYYCSTVNDARTLYKLNDTCYLKLQSQYPKLAEELNRAGIGMMLVNSFTKTRSDAIVALHGGDTSWEVFPGGLGVNRDPMVSDHIVRPFDVYGAAVVAPTLLTWVDAKKLIALGYSHGGTAVMAMDLTKHPVNQIYSTTGAKRFKKIFSTYPGCGMGGVNTNYPGSGAVVPLVLGTGSADPLMANTTMPGQPAMGNCRARYDAAAAAALSSPALATFDWWNYTDATHGWEYTASGPNNAARVDWHGKLKAYAVSIK